MLAIGEDSCLSTSRHSITLTPYIFIDSSSPPPNIEYLFDHGNYSLNYYTKHTGWYFTHFWCMFCTIASFSSNQYDKSRGPSPNMWPFTLWARFYLCVEAQFRLSYMVMHFILLCWQSSVNNYTFIVLKLTCVPAKEPEVNCIENIQQRCM